MATISVAPWQQATGLAHQCAESTLFTFMGKPTWLQFADKAGVVNVLFPFIVGMITLNTLFDVYRLTQAKRHGIEALPAVQEIQTRVSFTAPASVLAITAVVFKFVGVAAVAAVSPYVFLGALGILAAYHATQLIKHARLAKTTDLSPEQQAVHGQEAIKHGLKVVLTLLAASAIIVTVINPIGALATLAFAVTGLTVCLIAWSLLKAYRPTQAQNNKLDVTQHIKSKTVSLFGLPISKPSYQPTQVTEHDLVASR